MVGARVLDGPFRPRFSRSFPLWLRVRISRAARKQIRVSDCAVRGSVPNRVTFFLGDLEMCVQVRKCAWSLAVFGVVVYAITGSAMASTITQIEATTAGTSGTIDNASGQYPVVTSILSQPGTFNGKTYTSWAYLVNDGTGSIDVFGTPTFSPAGYTPAVGDLEQVKGKYSPYNQIPEMGSPLTVTQEGSGAAVPAPLKTTVSAINVATLPENLAGYLVEPRQRDA